METPAEGACPRCSGPCVGHPSSWKEPKFGKSLPGPDGLYWFELDGGFPVYLANGTAITQRIQYRCIGFTEDGQMLIQARIINSPEREAERFGEMVWE